MHHKNSSKQAAHTKNVGPQMFIKGNICRHKSVNQCINTIKLVHRQKYATKAVDKAVNTTKLGK